MWDFSVVDVYIKALPLYFWFGVTFTSLPLPNISLYLLPTRRG